MKNVNQQAKFFIKNNIVLFYCKKERKKSQSVFSKYTDTYIWETMKNRTKQI